MQIGVNMIFLCSSRFNIFCPFSIPVHGFCDVSGKEIGIITESKTDFKSRFFGKAFHAKDFKNLIVKYLASHKLPTTIEFAEPGGSLDAENVCGLSGKFYGGASDLDRSAILLKIFTVANN
jgi:hypothetical protein